MLIVYFCFIYKKSEQELGEPLQLNIFEFANFFSEVLQKGSDAEVTHHHAASCSRIERRHASTKSKVLEEGVSRKVNTCAVNELPALRPPYSFVQRHGQCPHWAHAGSAQRRGGIQACAARWNDSEQRIM